MSKGKLREREAAELYERAGFETYRPQESKYGETDIFGLFDIFALDGHAAALAQVKANQTRNITDWFAQAKALRGFANIDLHYLICHDYEGWRVAVPYEENYRWVVDERKSDGRMGELVVEYLRGDGE